MMKKYLFNLKKRGKRKIIMDSGNNLNNKR